MKRKYFKIWGNLLGESKRSIIFACILIAIQSAFVIGENVFSAYYGIDVALVSRDVNKLLFCAITIFLLTLTDTILFHIMYRMNNKEAKVLGVKLRKRIFNKAIYLDMDYHNHHASGAILNTIDYDVDMFCEGMTWTLQMLIRHFTRIVICFLLVTILNPRLSLILWVIAPLFFIAAFFISRKQSKIHEKRRMTNRKRVAYINEGIMGVKTIKSLNLEDQEKKEFSDLNKKYFRYRLQAVGLSQIFWRLFDIAFYTSLAALFLLSYRLNVSYGSLFLYYTLFRLCLNSITEITNNIDSFVEEMVSMEKVDALLNYEPIVKDKEKTLDINTNLKGDIKFENVTFTYKEGETVLKDFNLEIKAKQKVAIVGKTGSGKSTIASLLFRFYEPNKGRITLDGYDYTDLKLQYIHSQIGFILQEPFLFDDTITNNVKYGKNDATFEEVVNACKLVGAHDFISKLKNGYDTDIGESGIILSIGQKQLIAFARIVLSNPDIIILDEATSNIDSQTEALIQKNIETLFKDKTCLFIAHRLSTIRHVDNIIYLEKGKIIESGNHEELMELNGKYATLYNNQFIESNLRKILE